ncbi:MAG: LacI family DNA-binding transcriptional regulator, partial [Thermoleophilia bacterium]|nr:LacI family DNA-binding transcriptional regulator [Thermoleophilia bacterium]
MTTAPTRPPTILDVARRSGVSKSTVSNVLRDVASVAPSTRARVLTAIRELGYRPNAVARGLVSQRTNTLGILVGDLANPFYSELAKLVEGRASAAGYATIICNTDGRPESEAARIESLLEHRVAGLVMLQFSGNRDVLRGVTAEGTPLVVASGWESEADCVAVDDREAAALGVR